MLEQALAENTAALREILDLLRAAPWYQTTIADRYAQQKAISDEPPLTACETKAAAAAVVGNAKDTSASNTSSLAPTSPATTGYEAVVTKVRRLAEAGKRDLIVNALAAFGCANAKNLRPEQYAEFLEVISAADA
jgi:hypothetical protein